MLWLSSPAKGITENIPFDYLGDKYIAGTVLDENAQPLAGASVVLIELNIGTLTDERGFFRFAGLRSSVYTLEVKYLGFRPQYSTIDLFTLSEPLVFRLEPTHIELDEVVVRESRSGMIMPEQSLSITLANRDFLGGASAGTLVQNLQRLPGINSIDVGTGISKPVIRGLGFNRIVVAQHNIKQQGQQWGADHGLEVDPYAIERVEVIKGPAALMFGSDAIGGALNIRPPVIPQENTTHLEYTVAAYSNNDLLGNSLMAAINRNGRFLRLRASYQDYADYRVPAESFVYNTWRMQIPDRRLKNTSGNDLGLSLITGVRRPRGVSSLSISSYRQVAGFFPASHGIPNPGALLEPGNPRETAYPRQEVDHLMAMWNNMILLGSNRLEVDLGFQRNHRQELNPPHVHGQGPMPEGFTELELLLYTLSAGVRYNHRVSEQQSWVYGLSTAWQDNQRGGYNFLLPDYRHAEMGVFAISRTALADNVWWNAGIRTDVAYTDIAGYEEPVWEDAQTISHYRQRAASLQRSFYNLSFSTGISWMPVKDLNLKANLGTGFRNPSAIELSANGIHHGSFRHELGDTALTTERAYQFDLGATWSAHDFYVHLSPFVNYFPGFLFLNPGGLFSPLPGAGQIWRYEQAQAVHLGGELYTDWHVTHALHTSLAAEWVWAQNLENGYPLPGTPPVSLLSEFNYSFYDTAGFLPSLTLKGSLRWVAAQNRVARNEPPTASYMLVNVGVQANIRLFNQPAQLMFMVNNAFNTLYQNHLSFYRILELPEPGRNFTIRFTTSLQRKDHHQE